MTKSKTGLLLVWVGAPVVLCAAVTPESVPRMPAVIVVAPHEIDRVEGPYLPEGAPMNTQSADTTEAGRAGAVDSPALLRDIPGAAVVRNGPQTGIVQLHGLSGDRVKILVDGMTISPACPNHMDPPMHYAAPSSVETLTVMAGVTPVSLGGDSLGGTVLVQSAQPRFASREDLLGFGEAGAFYRSSNDGFGGNWGGGVATRKFSAAYVGSWAAADDLRFPGGRVRDTGYETQQHRLLTGFRTRDGVLSLDAGILRTRDAGTPSLPMDMIEDDGYRVGLKYRADYDFGTFEGRCYYHTIDHLMDNYSLRPVPAGGMRMFSPAGSDDYGSSLDLSLPTDIHTFRAGTGFHLNTFQAYQQNALNGLQQDTLNDATRARVGTHAEWQADWTDQWTTQLGVRNDTVMSDAGNINRFFAAGAADAAQFNRRDHGFTDVNFDVAASVRYTPNTWSAYELGFARKNRAPSLLERYLWTPLSASAGQADGRTYLGNLDLDSETSHQIAFTAEYHGEKWKVQATPYSNWIGDYIQGAPLSRTAGTPPQRVLQYQNLDHAELYGVDVLTRYDWGDRFTLRGQLSYVRGTNEVNGDNLYRIAPLRGTAALDYRIDGWRSSIEMVLVDSQNHVAAFNSEPTTPGYALLNLRTGYVFRNHLEVQVGLDNATDEYYADHLGGINRVFGSDVAVNQRMPGPGRFVFIQAACKF